MGKHKLEQYEEEKQLNAKEWHKKLIRENGEERAIRKIKTQLPIGIKLKDYMDALKAEIASENKQQ